MSGPKVKTPTTKMDAVSRREVASDLRMIRRVERLRREMEKLLRRDVIQNSDVLALVDACHADLCTEANLDREVAP